MTEKKRKVIFTLGFIAMVIGITVLGIFGWKRISREIEKHRLLKECVVFEIPDLDIKAPVMDGTEHEITGRWDLIIAFPPCTHLAVSGAAWFEKKRADVS